MALAENLTKLILLILPAMIANGTPVVARKIYGSGTPIDFGKNWLDGRPLFGPGKTWEGLLSGVITGTMFGIIEGFVFEDFRFYVYGAFLSSIGALIGDIIGSFLKRRLGIKRGEPAPILDQLDFYIGAISLLYIGGYELSLAAVLVFAPIILFLHVTTNWIAHQLKLKEVPH